VAAGADRTDDLGLLGLERVDPDELPVMESAAALLAPMLKRFLALDLSDVGIDGEFHYGLPPTPP
jgi:hypothetical protein